MCSWNHYLFLCTSLDYCIPIYYLSMYIKVFLEFEASFQSCIMNYLRIMNILIHVRINYQVGFDQRLNDYGAPSLKDRLSLKAYID